MLRTTTLASSLTLAFAATLAAQQPCEDLMKLALPHTTITSAAVVAGTAAIPAHCDVKATARPTSDSEINFELWLPPSDWNGKYQQVGNGGWAGNIPTGLLRRAPQARLRGGGDGRRPSRRARRFLGHRPSRKS